MGRKIKTFDTDKIVQITSSGNSIYGLGESGILYYLQTDSSYKKFWAIWSKPPETEIETSYE